MGMTFFGKNEEKFIQLAPVPCDEEPSEPRGTLGHTKYYDIVAAVADVIEE